MSPGPKITHVLPGRLPPGILPIWLSLVLMSCAAGATSEVPEFRGGRIMPPQGLTCDRNQLTSWTGRVTAYERGTDLTRIEIHTDESTLEQLTIRHSGEADASSRFLLWGNRFSIADWQKIESAPGILREGMRATAWICEDDETPPLVDWQPRQR